MTLDSYDRVEDKSRTITVHGVTFRIDMLDPYGHWKITPDKGLLPACLRDAYTSPKAAKTAIISYMEAKKAKEDKAAKRIEEHTYKSTNKKIKEKELAETI
jgi:hypothetical protein